ncbi:MAG: hypothetical protein KAS04_06650 [Candidatus Aenigmarchaeota archaeon]|nr:hypothetical protein [Candidatus Aenigmarchaeota archaeon]
MSNLISSISYDQHEILQNIIDLHLDGNDIQWDATYGNGSFYKKGINRPVHCSDISPKYDFVSKVDCRDTAFFDGLLGNIMFDPPFLMTTGKGSIIKDRFGSYSSMEDLYHMYHDSVKEFNRVLKTKGILIIKMQNTVMSGKQWWSVNQIEGFCFHNGFAKIDEFVLLAKHRMGQHNLKKQRHARKYHCYFLVFKKE